MATMERGGRSRPHAAAASRRTVLWDATKLAAGGALAALVGGRSGGRATRGLAAPAPVELPRPQVLRSANGELAVTLTAMPGVVDVGAPRPVTTYTYDNVVPGYTWEINPGDILKVQLVNNLPAMPHLPAMEMTRPHEWTWTNLHTHGLHVSPAGNADNVFLAIAPARSSATNTRCRRITRAGSFGTTRTSTVA